jgi:hypothetical protein
MIDAPTFLEIVRRISDIRDLREHEKVAEILGVHFTEIRSGMRLDFRPITRPAWLGDINYVLGGSPAGSELQSISLSIGAPPCVTPEDVRAKFGNPNLNSSTVPVPVIPTFIDEKSARTHLDEIEHGPGVIAMNYHPSQEPNMTLSFYFGLQKCLQSAGVSIGPSTK